MIDRLHPTVFDCVVFGQSLINPRGPAAECIEQAKRGRIRLFISDFILTEILELPTKIRSKIVTFEQAERLVNELKSFAVLVNDFPVVYTHPIDPDDSAYINLALATASNLIVSRDRHLLRMMDDPSQWAVDFRRRFPQMMILPPDTFVGLLRREEEDLAP